MRLSGLQDVKLLFSLYSIRPDTLKKQLFWPYTAVDRAVVKLTRHLQARLLLKHTVESGWGGLAPNRKSNKRAHVHENICALQLL